MRTSFMIIALAAFPLAVSAGMAVAAPLSEAECEATWKKAGGADLDPDKAKPFIKSFEQVDVDHNGAINWEEFKAGCGKGLVSG